MPSGVWSAQCYASEPSYEALWTASQGGPVVVLFSTVPLIRVAPLSRLLRQRSYRGRYMAVFVL